MSQFRMPTSKNIIINVPEDLKTNRENQRDYGEKAAINILCFDITNYSELSQFLFCTVFVFVCYLSYGYYMEVIYAAPDVESMYVTLMQFMINVLLSYIESMIRNPIKRKVPLRTYLILAPLTLGTMLFSNLALSYLNYPTQLIFKSCKLIPVMIGSIFILGKRYSFLDYVAAVTMCIGLTMFTLADSLYSPKFDYLGVIIISLALLCDAVIGNVQEKAMRQHQASNNEVVFYSYAIASVYLVVITAITGELVRGYYYCAKNPVKIYTNIVLLSVSGYLGLQAVLTLVRICGAAVAVTVTTMRKAFSIILSFLLFSKPFVFQYVWSGMLVVLAICLNHYSRKNPAYFPAWLGWCGQFIHGCYTSEYRYLKVRTKTYSDVV